ncbi:hypothetical protein C809_04093 [Lachnospiraceae bacterium MD335]|jgi:flagellar basal body L-ring protein FlgH|nr:hypothetical protein C809_04093 [Lachnospiraceae bacterium MD335]
MKTKKVILTLVSVLSLSVCSLVPAVTVSASNQVFSVEQYQNPITPRSDIIEWVYKTENGKLYKRLYNSSTASWIGDWIYVCEYPGEL